MTDAELAIGDHVEPEEHGLGAIARRRWESWKAGDVGVMPVVVGLCVIAAFFYSQNSNFLTAGNFTNLIVQMAAVTTIAIGVVFVLLLGEIDLSIGYVSGIAGVVAAKLQFPDGSWETTGLVAIIIAVIVTALIGLFQGSFVAIIGVPSFVVTLAGLLFWQGVILYSIGDQGVIVIDDSLVNNVSNYFFSDTAGYLIAAIATGLFVLSSLSGVFSRRRHGILTDNPVLVVLKLVGFAAIAFGAVYWANQERGFPVAFLLVIVLLVFWTWVAERTTFGRHVYAVGGNAEAARRAGINVRSIRLQRLHDLRGDGRPRRRHLRLAAQLRRPERRRRHDPARRDRRGGDRRHEPVRRPRPCDQRADGLARDRDGRERHRPAGLQLGDQVHGHRRDSPRRRDARHRLAPQAPTGRTLTRTVRTSLGIWALGPMVTRFVPGGYQPEHAGETTAERVRRAVEGLGDLIDDYEFHYPAS